MAQQIDNHPGDAQGLHEERREHKRAETLPAISAQIVGDDVRIQLAIAATLGLAMSVSLGAGTSVSSARKQPFLVFDGLLYSGKPDLSALGMPVIGGVNSPAASNVPPHPLDDAQVRATFEAARGFGGDVIYLDYEMWPTFHAPADEVSANIKNLKHALQIAHQTVPGKKFGFYNVVPCWDYWGLVKNNQAAIKQWEDCNARMDELAQDVDIVMPSLYTYYDDPRGWDIYAAELLRAARRYNKPVYVFLWPEFHVSNRFLRGKNVPGDFWRHELEFCKSRADGIVIWGGWQEQWNENADWWKETKAFLAGLNSQ
jgi:hypothetical protein